MLKALGALLLMAAPMGFALSAYTTQLRRDRLLAAFLKSLEQCAGQIRCTMTALPSLAEHLSQQGPEELRSFWWCLRSGLLQSEVDLGHLWRDALLDLGLSTQARQILSAVPQILRSYDAERIAQELLRLSDDLAQHRQDAAETFRRDFKAHTGMQLSAALLLLILLF